MRKLVLVLVLLSGLGYSQVTPVGGYLPLNSSKSYTAGGAKINGNLNVTGTGSIGSTFTAQSVFTPSSTIGTVKMNNGTIIFDKLQSGLSNGIYWNQYGNSIWSTGIDITTKDLFLAWDSVGGKDRIRLSPGGKTFIGGAGTPSANIAHVTIKSAGTTSATGAFGVVSSTNSGLASTPFLFFVRDDGKVKIGGNDNPIENLDVTGNIAVRSGAFINAGNGTVGAPAYTFSNAPTTGMCCNLGAANRLSFVVNGAQALEMTGTTANFFTQNISNVNQMSSTSVLASGSASFGTTLKATTTTTLVGGVSFDSVSGAAIVGTVSLNSGTATVNTTKAVTGAYIFFQRKTSGGTIGTSTTYTVNNGTSFTITSDNVLDTSTFNWWIINP